MDTNKFLTLEQRIKEAFLLQEYVLPNWLGVVFRGTKFSRFLYPGQPNRMSRIGREKVVGYLSLETVYLPFRLTNLLTKDGHLFQANGKIAYVYDPSISNQIDQYLYYLIESLKTRQPVQDEILTVFTQHIRSFVGDKTARELMDGSTSSRLGRALSRTLSRELKDFGVKIDSHTGVTIGDLIPPMAVQDAHEKGFSHLLEVASGLAHLTEKQLQELLQVRIVENGNMTLFMTQGGDDIAGSFFPYPSFAPITPESSNTSKYKH